MKKIINTTELVEEQMIGGMVKAHPEYLTRLPDELVLLRSHKKQGKVALISGGGSGHEPAHGGYVGYGMLDGAVAGPVFTSPSVDPICKGIKAVDAGKGVLMVIKNYTGDVLNFEMAGEQAFEESGIRVAKVIVNDDVAVENSTWTTGRRGVAGTVFVHKIAGAKAESGAELEEVQACAQKVVDNVRSMGMAIKPCTVPAAGVPGFELAEDEVEIGIGIHGEPGVKKGRWEPADVIADQMLEKILGDLDYSGSEVAVMINGCGGTPLMELYIVENHVADVLASKGISVYRTFVGNYMTSLEMEGFSITLLRLDEEMKELLDAPADTPAFKVCGAVPAENSYDEAAGNSAEQDRVKDVPGKDGGITDGKDIRAGFGAAETAETTGNAHKTDSETGIDRDTFLRILKNMIDSIEREKQRLTELDNVIGDGDHGINMARGFQAVSDRMPEYEQMGISEILQDVGKVLMKTVGGSSGPLYGSAFKKSGAVVKGKNRISLADLAAMLKVSMEQIGKLGRSAEGEKTMLDAMGPALQALESALKAADKADPANLVTGVPETSEIAENSGEETTDSAAALKAALKAAEEGTEYTKSIIATKGRASYLGERSLGHIDPGAASFTVLLEAVVETILSSQSGETPTSNA